ncbi:MAG TPA: hypothetical protein VM328_02505, partial [Fimbriimonadaceae bacterium]|nr:hypothetical protein [Fimbriimonadaceae bacterium]
VYAESVKPFPPVRDLGNAQHEHDDVLELNDFIGRRFVETKLRGHVTIREENAIAALETISRFAVNPKWLVYLPPTMSPSETSELEGYLEHPREAFAYFRREGVETVVCEEKHMGSRAVTIVLREPSVAKTRFGIDEESLGIVYTRTGRRFFEDLALERAVLDDVRQALHSSCIWDELQTDWVVLDCELMPWSAKAQELLRRQYAPVATAGQAATSAAVEALGATAPEDAAEIRTRLLRHRENLIAYRAAYRRYCWDVAGLSDLRLAPFHLLASEGVVHADKNHGWHMETLSRLKGQVLYATRWREISLLDEEAVSAAIAWWEEMTGAGGEGMVVKPLEFVVRGPKGLSQPAIKCRGREYLRIIYGPSYTDPENLMRLRKRGLGIKRSLAAREFALGLEGLERFVAKEPLRRVHECAFGVLAMESEPVDPRL